LKKALTGTASAGDGAGICYLVFPNAAEAGAIFMFKEEAYGNNQPWQAF
jgi:hypothetical protein